MMTDVTKEKALDKLSKITTKIGYPDKWRAYEGLEIRPDDLVGNLMRSARYELFSICELRRSTISPRWPPPATRWATKHC